MPTILGSTSSQKPLIGDYLIHIWHISFNSQWKVAVWNLQVESKAFRLLLFVSQERALLLGRWLDSCRGGDLHQTLPPQSLIILRQNLAPIQALPHFPMQHTCYPWAPKVIYARSQCKFSLDRILHRRVASTLLLQPSKHSSQVVGRPWQSCPTLENCGELSGALNSVKNTEGLLCSVGGRVMDITQHKQETTICWLSKLVIQRKDGKTQYKR